MLCLSLSYYQSGQFYHQTYPLEITIPYPDWWVTEEINHDRRMGYSEPLGAPPLFCGDLAVRNEREQMGEELSQSTEEEIWWDHAVHERGVMYLLYWYCLERRMHYTSYEYLQLRLDGRDACEALGIKYKQDFPQGIPFPSTRNRHTFDLSHDGITNNYPIMPMMDGIITGRPRQQTDEKLPIREWIKRFPYEIACLVWASVTPQIINKVPMTLDRRRLMGLLHCSDTYINKAKKFYDERMGNKEFFIKLANMYLDGVVNKVVDKPGSKHTSTLQVDYFYRTKVYVANDFVQMCGIYSAVEEFLFGDRLKGQTIFDEMGKEFRALQDLWYYEEECFEHIGDHYRGSRPIDDASDKESDNKSVEAVVDEMNDLSINNTRQINRVRSGKRAITRRAKKVNTGNNNTYQYVLSKCEIDTRADTICCGNNFRPIEYTGQSCDVKGFHETLDTMKDIPVANCATAWRHPASGRVYILIVNEALYFGSSMDHSLINPNQIRAYGIKVWDNPYDTEREFGIELDDFVIPFDTEGSTIHFESHLPSDAELNSCPRIILTSDEEWDPQGINMSQKPRKWLEENEAFICQVSRDRNNVQNRHSYTYETDFILSDINDSFVEQELTERMVKSVKISEVHSKERHSTITPELISRQFRVGIDKAKEILAKTTQNGVWQAVHPLTRRYRVDHLNLHREYLGGKWSMDHMTAGVKSIRQNTGAFVISNGEFTSAHPKKTMDQYDAADSLQTFCDDVGIPKDLKTDMASSFVGHKTEFQKVIKHNRIKLSHAEAGRSNQIYKVDIEIRELKRRCQNKRIEKNVPNRLWDFLIEHQAKIMQFIPRGPSGRTGYELVTGSTPDISEYCDFDFYDLVWYHVEKHPPLSKESRQLARWIGVAHRIGSDLCYWLMPVSGTPIAETTVQHVTAEDLRDRDIANRIEEFDETLRTRLDDTNFKLQGDSDFYMEDFYDDSDDPAYGDGSNTPGDREYDMSAEKQDMDEIDSIDKYIGAQIILDDQHPSNLATVKRRVTGFDGRPVGTAHVNPLLDTREYEVLELEDGTTERYFANTIAENLWSQCDSEGRQFQLLKEITDHRKNGRALSKDDGYTFAQNGDKIPKKTTVGWDVLVEWTDGSTQWIPIKDVKDSNPIELAEYAIANKIAEEPAFAWWVPFVIKKRYRMINKVKKKYWRTTHKFGIKLPHSVEEALRIDKENGNDYWEKAIRKEMEKAKVAYIGMDEYTPDQVRSGNASGLIGFQEIKCHMIFDVKIDFTRKARFVAGGHMTEAPASLTYSSVVSRDSVKIAFLIGALNELDVMACDIGNAYLNAPCREKIWFVAGPECGQLNGKVCKLVRALYGESGTDQQVDQTVSIIYCIDKLTIMITRVEKLWCFLESDVFYIHYRTIRFHINTN